MHKTKMPMVNKVKIKTRYYLELLTPKTMKLLGSTKSKKMKMKTKDENSENLSHLEINEVNPL